MKTQVSIKRIIIDFIYIGNQLQEFFEDRKECLPIIEFLNRENYLDIYYQEINAKHPAQRYFEIGRAHV